MRFQIRTAGEDARYQEAVARERRRIRERESARPAHPPSEDKILTQVAEVSFEPSAHSPDFALSIIGKTLHQNTNDPDAWTGIGCFLTRGQAEAVIECIREGLAEASESEGDS